MPDFNAILDMFDLTFVYVSKESAALTGRKPEELIDQQITNFSPASFKKKNL